MSDLTIPEPSSGVKKALLEGNSEDVWSQFLEELVTYFTRHHGDRMKGSQDYQEVGKLLYESYPSIARFGKHPWVCTT